MKRGGNHLRIAKFFMSWLITGSSGQLGRALSAELTEGGYVFDALNSTELNITNDSMTQELIAKFSPSVIVNCAAWTDVDGAESNEFTVSRINGRGAENVALAAKKCDAKLIQISTDYVFSGQRNTPWEVDSLMNPQTVYGRTKAEGEIRVLSAYAEKAYILRTAWLYSPWRKNFAKTMTQLALNEKGSLRVIHDQVGQPTSALDLAKQIVDLAKSGSRPGIYHGTNSGQATWFEFAKEIFRIIGADISRVIPISSDEYLRTALRPSYSVLSHQSWSETSIQPMRDWRNALAESLPAIISAIESEE